MTRRYHSLKIAPRYYNDIVLLGKRFEVRKNDRDFHIGDGVRLEEWDGGYTHRFIDVTITYVLTSEDFPEGIQPGYCVFGFRLNPLDIMKEVSE